MSPHLHPSSEGGKTSTWTGTWVAERLGVAVRTTDAPIGVAMDALVGLAVRRNPRRAHLLVSTVLGKHVPTDARLVYGSGLLLGSLVAAALSAPAEALHPRDRAGGDLLRLALAGVPGSAEALVVHSQTIRVRRTVPDGTVVLGYAETATALGHSVADALEVPALHSTRRPVAGVTPVGGFEEEHSHATSHLLLPEDPALLGGTGPLVLVDDELSTGTTALNTIAALHAVHPRAHYLIAALVDLRSDADRARMAEVAVGLGTHIDVVALAAGRVDLPADVLTAGQRLVEATEARPNDAADSSTGRVQSSEAAGTVHPIKRVQLSARSSLRDGGRHGFWPADRAALEKYLADVAVAVTESIGSGSIHVLGCEEFMYAPLRLAQALAALHPDQTVTYSTTTRSPILAVADAGYAIRSRMVFGSHDNPADGPGDRFAYNVGPATAMDDRFGTVVLVVDAAADTPALTAPSGLVDQLAAAAGHVVVVVVPDYRPALNAPSDSASGASP